MSFKLDKAQRDRILKYLEVNIEMHEAFRPSKKDIIHILKSLKAMVESFDTTGKQVEDSGDVRHEQKGVTKNWVAEVLDSIDDYEG